MSNHATTQPRPTIQPKDRVRVDHGDREYTVQAVSRAGQDVYLTDGADTSTGTWVAITSVTPIDREATR